MSNRKNMMRDGVVVGFALFAMFFGAGSILFPPYLGMECGKEWMIGFICFFLGDIGIAFTSVVAMINGDGTLESITGFAGKIPSLIINCATMICLGPLLAIPRTAATTMELMIVPIIPSLNKWVFVVIYFALVVWLTIRPNKVVDVIGKVLTPALVVCLVTVLGYGILHPIGEIGPVAVESSVGEGIINGYQTMDVFGAIGVMIIVIADINGRNYQNDKDRTKVALIATAIAGIMLFFVFMGLTYLGATASLKYNLADVNQASLLVAIVHDVLGQFGTVAFGVVVGLACLTTGISILSAVAAYFDSITHGKLSYKFCVISICIFSAIVSNFGLSFIINIAAPILSVLYPPVIVLVILSFFKKKIRNGNIYKLATLFTFIVSLLTVIQGYGVSALDFINKLPFSGVLLNWVVPAIVGGIIGAFIPDKKNTLTSQGL